MCKWTILKNKSNTPVDQIFKICLMILTLLIVSFYISSNVHAGIFGDCNYYECILDEMPGVKNDFVARQIIANCSSKCPDSTTKKKTRLGFSGKMTASKCFLKYAKDTNSELGARIIRYSCYSLYQSD